MYICAYVWVNAHVNASAHGIQKTLSDILKLEL